MAVKRAALTLFILFIATSAMAASPPPDMNLLEFLGDFVTAGGRPVDPVQFKREKKDDRRTGADDGKGVQRDGKSARKEKEDESTRHR